MIRDTFEDIKNQVDVRANLIKLKAELKEGHNKAALLYYIGGDYTVFEQLLYHEDAKVRKNTALIIGELAVQEFLEKLMKAYKKESQLFVRSSYLTALKKIDYKSVLPSLHDRLQELSSMEVADGDKKHINEEMRVLSDLIIAAEGIKRHVFTGFHKPSQVVLLTNRNFISETMEQIKDGQAKEFNAGVIVKTTDLTKILPIRTYSELLFMLDDRKTCDRDPITAAKNLAESSLLQFLIDRHEDVAPFYFRIELKSKEDLEKRSAFTKKMGIELERLTSRQLINSPSNYEFEIRLIENKEGKYNILIKLFTLVDERFSYRKNAIATSIHPVNAALISFLAKDYLKEGAQILDPFCGVGTMLIERHKLVKADTIYGLDIYGDAIEMARENSKAARTIVHYINRDFFDFKHTYLFDEIITNMPRIMGHATEADIYELYHKFFKKAKEHLIKDGIMILYSHNRDFVRKLLNREHYRLEQEYEISKKEGAYLYIIRNL